VGDSYRLMGRVCISSNSTGFCIVSLYPEFASLSMTNECNSTTPIPKDTQPENTKVRPSQGSLRSTSRISSQLTSMRMRALGLGSKVGRSKY
jgi:hypothetical protein